MSSTPSEAREVTRGARTVVLLVIAVLVGLVLIVSGLLSSCTQTTRTTVLSAPLTVEGPYSIAWPDASRGTANVTDVISLAPYPCAVTPDIGGSYEYDPGTGIFAAELKTVGGDVKVTISGRFAGLDMNGTVEVLVLGLPCLSGPISMHHE